MEKILKFLSSYIGLILQFIALFLFYLWWKDDRDYEPLIGLIITTGTIITGIIIKIKDIYYPTKNTESISKGTSRPRIQLQQTLNLYTRRNKGYHPDNPREIWAGDKTIKFYWDLDWYYNLLIRNNSSVNAYDIHIEYINLPPYTEVLGEIGKIDPILANSEKVIEIHIINFFAGTSTDADKKLQKDITELMKNIKVIVSYNDDRGFHYKTEYTWLNDENALQIIN